MQTVIMSKASEFINLQQAGSQQLSSTS